MFGLVLLGVEDEIDLDALVVADDRDGVEIDTVPELEAEHLIERHRAVEIAHPNADMVDAVDGDMSGCGHAGAPFAGRMIAKT